MKRARFLLCILIMTLAGLFGGCALLGDYTLAKRSEIDGKIAAARVETETKMTALGQRELSLLNTTIGAHVQREQAAADYLFKGLVVGGGLSNPTRPEMVMSQSIQQTATQLPPATPAAQAATLRALQVELDEVKTTTEALRTKYEKELQVARTKGEAKAKTIKELGEQVQAVETERVAVLAQAAQVERGLQEAKDMIQDRATQQAQEEAARAKSVQAIKTKMSAIVGGLALLCLAGAIWSPVYKSKFGLGAAVLGLAAVGIWYIQPWHLALAVGVLVLGLVGWAAKNHYIESRAATNVYRAIQAVKDTAHDDYERVLKPRLNEWNTIYGTGSKPEPDAAVVKHIDERLKEVGDL